MRILTAEIIADESGHPLKVQMDYDEFLRVRAEIEGAPAPPDEATGLENSAELMAFAGRIKWDEDPVDYQRRLRDEWD